jgi:putative nucleotidyltransferase with HDIG domain
MKKISVVSDRRDRLDDLRNQLAGCFDANYIALDDLLLCQPNEITLVDINLRNSSHVQTIKQWLNSRPADGKLIVGIDDEDSRIQLTQAHALGATSVLSRPSNGAYPHLNLLGTLKALCPDHLSNRHAAGFRALQEIFLAAGSGKVPEPTSIKMASAEIVADLERVGLEEFLCAIRRHHSQTYQHCLTVTAVAAAFGEHLGFNHHDTEMLAFAGLLHDIGKSKIPIELLEKPSTLSESEAKLMQLHPRLGFELLHDRPDFSRDMLDMVLHHHEYLDGSGYPDGLKGNEISDLVRIITIADVYTALIERRAYKEPLSGKRAFEILRSMDGKLDDALLREFGPVVRELS